MQFAACVFWRHSIFSWPSKLDHGTVKGRFMFSDNLRPAIAAMSGYVPGEQLNSSDIIKLNTNENPYPASPKVVEAIEAAAIAGLQRYPSAMAQPFRDAAADTFGIDPESVLCGNGSDDILTILTRAFVGEGELLRFPRPSYILYGTLAEIQGARSEQIPFEPDWTLPDSFGSSSDGLKLVYLPNPNSPSGTVVSREAILKLADRLPCPLVVDEAYADFAEFNCLDLPFENEKILVTRTLSKSYGLAGLRFGFLVAQPDVVRELIKVKDSYNCDTLSIAAATAAVRDQDWLQENRARVLKTRDLLMSGMKRLGFDVVDSQANFTWNTHASRPLKPIYESLKEQDILVRYMEYPGWGEGLRISVGTDEQIEKCLDRIAVCVQNG
jgi:histidinol-phosphate aminotransferase